MNVRVCVTLNSPISDEIEVICIAPKSDLYFMLHVVCSESTFSIRLKSYNQPLYQLICCSVFGICARAYVGYNENTCIA